MTVKHNNAVTNIYYDGETQQCCH